MNYSLLVVLGELASTGVDCSKESECNKRQQQGLGLVEGDASLQTNLTEDTLASDCLAEQ